MGDKNYLLGIDIGSSGCKVSLLDLKEKQITTLSDETTTFYPRPGWAEQKPEDWINLTGLLVKKILKEKSCQAKDILAIGFSGVTHSLVMLDKDRNVLGRAIHLTDNRSYKQSQKLKEKAGDMILEIALNTVNVMWTISMLDWVREKDNKRWRKISRILFPKDYVRFRLTGSEATDYIDAQGTLLFDPKKKEWDQRLTDLINLDPKVLPELAEPIDIIGKITSEGSSWSGLKEGTPVITGTTDTLLEIFAAGSKKTGDCTIKLATFGRICVLAEGPFYGNGLVNYSYIIPGMWYPGTGTRSCGTSLRWCRDQFYRNMDVKNIYSFMDDEAGKIPPGAEGLIFHPYMQGEGSPYDDPRLRGDFIGLTLHHTRGHLTRSVLEGVSFSLLDSINFIKEKGVIIRPPLRFLGGGSNSRLWTGILSDVLGEEAIVPENTDPSVGACLIAGVGIGIFEDYQEAQDFNSGTAREVPCNEINNSRYKRIFKIYKESQRRLQDINHLLAEENERNDS